MIHSNKIKKAVTKALTFLFFTTVTLGLFSGMSLAQNDGDGGYEPSEERSSFQELRKSIMDGNQLRATYHNNGHAGKIEDVPDELQFEYPRNTDRYYMYFMSTMIGAEVPNQKTSNPDDSFHIVDVAAYRNSPEGDNWNMNPITGYAAEGSDEFARSDDPDTWPSTWPDKSEAGGWPGSWNGFFGRDQFNADVEFFYRAGDDRYKKYVQGGENASRLFRPDSTDPDRGGLAIKMDTRVMAWSQVLINSTHFNIFEIMNDASYNYDKVAFGLWIADLVAGTASDDQPQFDDIRSIAYLTDVTRSPAPPEFDGPVGEMGIKILESPGNSSDGIDNDGDSDFHNSTSNYYDPEKNDLYSEASQMNGGFYPRSTLTDSVLPTFAPVDFESRTLTEGDKMVLIDDNNNRIIREYVPGDTIWTKGMDEPMVLPQSLNVVEDFFPEESANSGIHVDLQDNDFDGLIDENQPNHLEKQTFINDRAVTRPVSYINYLYFEPGDTLKRGLMVPNSQIRERISSDNSFANLVNEVHDGRFINKYTAALMLDEGRADYFDNDQDWKVSNDDVGINGNPDDPARGQGDGFPTSGAGTSLPGEPNIDKTDVSETDLLGVTNVSIFSAGLLNVDQDETNWSNYLTPGEFDREAEQGTDSDIFVSSGLFPLDRGESQRFAVAVTAVQTKSPNRRDDRQATNANLVEATNAYEADYQFATAPNPPKLKAVSGDGYVKLYWDKSAENSFDRYVERLTGNGFDFEGYRIYKATDPAFEDAKNVTDAFGNPQFNQPEVIFDENNGISGLHPIPVNGTQYDMGDDSGLQYTYTDENVTNGKKYFYAVTAFDYGVERAGIAPSESPIQINRAPSGRITFGQNVLSIRPSPSQAGYIDAKNPKATLKSGSPGGEVLVDIVNSDQVIQGNTYRVVFQDTVIEGEGTNPDTIKTKNFSLLDVTNSEVDTMISKSTKFNGEPIPPMDGFQLEVLNETEFGINDSLSGWTQNEIEQTIELTDDSGDPVKDTTLTRPHHKYEFGPASTRQKLSDYMIVFDTLGYGQSSNQEVERDPGDFRSYESVETNFRIFNTYDSTEIDYAMFNASRNVNIIGAMNPQKGEFSSYYNTNFLGGISTNKDVIYFIEDYQGEEDVATYQLSMAPLGNIRSSAGPIHASINPQPGDTLFISVNKPFVEGDVFEFRMSGDNLASVNNDSARKQLDDVTVVPNPYVVSNPYEPAITANNPQQQREIQFHHVPVPATLRIFNMAGVLVDKYSFEEGDTRVTNGLFRWDVLTKDNLELSYGVYLYHLKAPGIGETTGKFAIIK